MRLLKFTTTMIVADVKNSPARQKAVGASGCLSKLYCSNPDQILHGVRIPAKKIDYHHW